jgi:ABC-type enterobactin transport system permease subunit
MELIMWILVALAIMIAAARAALWFVTSELGDDCAEALGKRTGRHRLPKGHGE